MTVEEELVSIAERLRVIAESLTKEETEITLEELRAVLVQKSKDHKEEVKAILTSHGAKTLSELDTACYKAVMEEVRKIE